MDSTHSNKFIKELDDKLRSYEGLQGDPYRETLREQYALAKRFYEFLLKPDGTPDGRLFDDIAMSMDADVMGWIVELPFALSDHGAMVDEAIEICNLFAELHSPDNFLGDMAVILAEAGRREEAYGRVTRNLERFPDDAWVIIKCGDAYRTLKETDKAFELYNRAYGMTSPLTYDRDGVLERLVPLLKELGRETEADALIETEEEAKKARQAGYKSYKKQDTDYLIVGDKQKPISAGSGKIGRNEPCPCGSDKKYKKCCGK